MIIRNIKCDNIDLEVQHDIPFLLIWIISPFVLLYYTILYILYYVWSVKSWYHYNLLYKYNPEKWIIILKQLQHHQKEILCEFCTADLKEYKVLKLSLLIAG